MSRLSIAQAKQTLAAVRAAADEFGVRTQLSRPGEETRLTRQLADGGGCARAAVGEAYLTASCFVRFEPEAVAEFFCAKRTPLGNRLRVPGLTLSSLGPCETYAYAQDNGVEVELFAPETAPWISGEAMAAYVARLNQLAGVLGIAPVAQPDHA